MASNTLAMFQTILKSRVDEDICLLIQPQNVDFHCIVDCGQASDLTVKDCQDALLICVTHTHIDHFINFDSFIRHQIGTGRRYTIVGPRGLAHNVQSKLRGYLWNLIQENAIHYEVREIDSNGNIARWLLSPPAWELQPLEDWQDTVVYSHPKFDVHFTLLDHKTETVAYLFQAKDTVTMDIKKSPFPGGAWVKALKEAFENEDKGAMLEVGGQKMPAADLFHLLERKKGYRLGVIMDHAANPENHQKITELFGGADEVWIESFYKAADQPNAEANFHSYSIASGSIMRQAGVQKAIPVHFSRRYEAADIQELLTEFEGAFAGVTD